MQYVSDLHPEFNGFPEIPKIKDTLIIAGDSSYGGSEFSLFESFINKCSRKWKHVVYVPGNHDYYSECYTVNDIDCIFKSMFSKYSNTHYLNNSIAIINDKVFAGSCLWCNPVEIRGFADFKRIPSMTKKEMSKLHENSVSFLKKTFNEYTNVVCITHFPPIQCTWDKKIYSYKESSYFGNNMEDIIISSSIKYWIYGHTHWSASKQIGNCKLYSNQFGYPNESTEFNPESYIPP